MAHKHRKRTEHEKYERRGVKRKAKGVKTTEVIDGKPVTVTRYPPGCASGYRDIQNWADRRRVGMAGNGQMIADGGQEKKRKSRAHALALRKTRQYRESTALGERMARDRDS